MYRRRRAMAAVVAATLGGLALVGLAVVLRVLLGVGPLAPTAATNAVPQSEAPLVVRSGDTVWDIARALDPRGDVRATVDRIVAANGGASLRVGQRLVVPP